MAKAEIRKPKPKQNPLKAADVTVIDYNSARSLRQLRMPVRLHCFPTPALAANEKESNKYYG